MYLMIQKYQNFINSKMAFKRFCLGIVECHSIIFYIYLFVIFQIAFIEEVFYRTLLVVLYIAMDEDIRDGHADRNAVMMVTAATPSRIMVSRAAGVISWILSRAKRTR